MTASWRDDPVYQDAIRPGDVIATLERDLGEARTRLTLAQRINRRAIQFDPSNEETRAEVGRLRQARAAAVDSAEADVARLEALLNDQRMRHSVAIGEAATRAIGIECADLTERLQRAMPRLLELIAEAVPLAVEIADIAQTIERDMSETTARKLGAALGCPGPVPLAANLAGWLAQARAAGWGKPASPAQDSAELTAGEPVNAAA